MTRAPAIGSGSGRAPQQGARLVSPAFERNAEPIRLGLAALLPDATGPAAGSRPPAVLEIGSGPGQHAAHFAAAFPALVWQPTDIDAAHLASIAAWREAAGCPGLNAPFPLDASADWAALPEVGALGPLAAVLAVNIVHIAPWAVTQGIVAGAGRALAPGGRLILYGPFAEGGRHTGAGNARFDAALRAQNPDWGVRDLDDLSALAAAAGLGRAEIREMPANNRLVAWTRTADAAPPPPGRPATRP